MIDFIDAKTTLDDCANMLSGLRNLMANIESYKRDKVVLRTTLDHVRKLLDEVYMSSETNFGR